ncbi:MAG: NAD(P)H-dependent oxidoreductase [Chromatiales bacterium]|jgi:nitroreductase
MNPTLEALQFRHACKKFDAQRKIPESELRDILECARLSPSSFGMEPWKFLVVQDAETRQRLRKACWDQPQITDSSDVIVILSKTHLTEPGNDYVAKQFRRRNLTAEAEAAYLQRYRQHCETEIEPLMSYYAWNSKQCYIALANIMTAAASVGIDSCPIEGFVKQAVEAALNIDPQQYEVAVLVALGYRAGEQSARLRLDFDEVVEFI